MDGQTYYRHHHSCEGGGEALIVLGLYYLISNAYRKWKMRRHIKKYLKIVVEFSNLIQDEKNILHDMRNANFPREEVINQRDYVFRLILKQKKAIHDLVNVELQYPGEIHNRFFYFKDKQIF